MCGIVGYIGPKEACPILINGLKRLEYRGYDSAGIALIHNNNIQVYKCKGRVQDLEHHMELEDTSATIGKGHTRWATHGEPNDAYAHPQTSMNGLISIVQYGIIENHALLKEKLQARGYSFQSETDTEVLANLIEYIYTKGQVNAENEEGRNDLENDQKHPCFIKHSASGHRHRENRERRFPAFHAERNF